MSEIGNSDNINEKELTPHPECADSQSAQLKEEKKTEEPKVLTLHFSSKGTEIKLQTQQEISQSAEFVKLNEPRPAPISISLEPSYPLPRKREGLLTSKVYSVLNDPVLDKMVAEYEAMSPEQKRIFDLSLDKKIRNNHRKKTSRIRNINLTFALKENNYKHYDFQAYLEQITKKLESEGLWREESAESLESNLFPIDDIKDDDLNDNLEPKALTLIYNPKKMSYFKDSLAELQEQGIEWKDELNFNPSDLPLATTPTSHNFMRRSPWSLEEKIARLMIEGTFFSKHPFIDELLPCAYFVSKSIFSRELFIQVKYEAFARTPLQKRFRTYSFRKYQADQKIFIKIVNETLQKYFLRNSHVVFAVGSYVGRESFPKSKVNTLLKSIWQRFFDVNRKLTKKQKSALEAIYIELPPLTYTEAALREKISRDSFQDRVRGAVKKMREAFPELMDLELIGEKPGATRSSYLYNGLFRKESALEVNALFRVDPNSNKKSEILPRTGKPNLNPIASNQTIIRAWAVASTPVPDILDTDFYLGLVPEGVVQRKKGRSRFR